MKMWKDFRTNLMYWRFRHVTRNRLRLRSWWQRRRTPRTPAGYTPYRARGVSSRPTYSAHSARRSWLSLTALVVLLTALSVGVRQTYISPGFVYIIGSLIVVGCIYWALRGT